MKAQHHSGRGAETNAGLYFPPFCVRHCRRIMTSSSGPSRKVLSLLPLLLLPISMYDPVRSAITKIPPSSSFPSSLSTGTNLIWSIVSQSLSKIACNRLQKELAEWQVSPPAGFKHKVTDNLQRLRLGPCSSFSNPVPGSLDLSLLELLVCFA